MIGRAMFPQRCKVWRLLPSKDEFGTPIGDDYTEIGSYSCRLSKSNTQTDRNNPETKITQDYALYLPANSIVQAGDLIEVIGAGHYRASKPYRPNGHHTEVPVEWEEEA